jgi:hypothetical protein
MVKTEHFPSSLLTELGRLYRRSDWVYCYTIQSVIAKVTMFKGIFNVCFYILTHLPIGALCEALENL